jgi:hypothetical protein
MEVRIELVVLSPDTTYCSKQLPWAGLLGQRGDSRGAICIPMLHGLGIPQVHGQRQAAGKGSPLHSQPVHCRGQGCLPQSSLLWCLLYCRDRKQGVGLWPHCMHVTGPLSLLQLT